VYIVKAYREWRYILHWFLILTVEDKRRHLYLVLTFRISGAATLLHPCDFMVWTGRKFYFLLPDCKCSKAS